MTHPARRLDPAAGVRLAEFITSHWPHPPMTPEDEAVLAASLAEAGVSEAEAFSALMSLVEDGREWQPRAPQIVAQVNVNRTKAAERAEPRPALPRGASPRDEEIDAQVAQIGLAPVRELVQRSIAAIRRREGGAHA